MSATQIGTSLLVGAQQALLALPNATNYILVSAREGERDVELDRVMDALGALSTIVVYKNYPKITVELICKTGATPTSDYVMGRTVSSSTPISGQPHLWYVESVAVNKTKSPHQVSVTLCHYDLAVVV